MKSKLYKTHRKPSYYRLRRLGYFSLSLMVATILVVVPLTLAQASSSSSSTSNPPSTSQVSSSSSSADASMISSSENPIEPITPLYDSDGVEKVKTIMVLEK